MDEMIKIVGARVNNLKNVDVEFPRNKITCFVGPSGSGKSSLAFHTIFSESKRRFLNSFPTYLKFFSDRPAPVDVEEISPVLPVFGLPQVNPVVGTRSNVADTMHLTEMLQGHFYNFSKEFCSVHHLEFEEKSFLGSLVEKVDVPDGERCYLFLKSEDFLEFFSNEPLPSRSLKSSRTKTITDFDKDHKFWEIARFKGSTKDRLEKKVIEYIKRDLSLFYFDEKNKKLIEIKHKKGVKTCPASGCLETSVKGLSMLHFSPYNALGACDECNGFGETLAYDENKLIDKEKSIQDGGVLMLNYKRYAPQKAEFLKIAKRKRISLTKPIGELGQEIMNLLYEGEGNYYGFNYYFSYLERKKYKMNVRIFIRNIQKNELCHKCLGTRLSTIPEQFFLDKEFNITLKDVLSLDIIELLNLFKKEEKNLFNSSRESKKSYKKIIGLLQVANAIGLGHLSLNRKAKSLSAGEYQRLLLLKYLSYDGTDSLFVFDEPSLGLSTRELKALVSSFRQLVERGNTVVLVEHSEYLMKESDYIVEMGPKAGAYGGELVFQGTSEKFEFPEFKNELKPFLPAKYDYIKMEGPEIYGKIYDSIEILKDCINWVKGASGSGKTSVIVNTLVSHIYYKNFHEHLDMTRGTFKNITGKLFFDDVIIVDANLNRYTSRSTVGSMTGLFPVVRKHFAELAVSKSMGLVDGHFSYNSALGQCPKCEGKGHLVVEMQFLEDVILECEDCHGKKLKPIYANISDGEMTVNEAFTKPLNQVLDRVRLTPKFQRIKKYLELLNLDYLSLDRQINSLSGGEKQRIYLLSKLQKNLSDSLIVFENISFGLSKKELISQSEFLQNLGRDGNTIIIIDQAEDFKHIAANVIEFS